ncbi:MAG: VOC family protein [Anaerolineae bacterium]|nr:VOC family protein [Anaerolineae bacterium]
MHKVTGYPDGVFCWVDLATTDVAGAKSFYSQLFGWEAGEQPTDGGMPYTTFRLNGLTVAGMGELMPEQREQGVPPSWSSYVKHDDADAIAARITGAGGNLLVPPMDVMEEGRFLMAQDPTGAVFGVWQPRQHTGAQLVNAPNCLVWNELQTREVDAAIRFYEEVFGWTGTVGDTGYVRLAASGRSQAGIWPIAEGREGVPSHWAVYFLVDDVAGTLRRAESLGATTVVPETAFDEQSSFAVLQDPQGAYFQIVHWPAEWVDPPPGA